MIILSMDKIAKTDIFVTGKWSFFIQIARAFPIIFGKKWNEKSCKRKSNPAKLFSKMFHKNLFFFFLIGYLPITNFSTYEKWLTAFNNIFQTVLQTTFIPLLNWLASFTVFDTYAYIKMMRYFHLCFVRRNIVKYIHNTITISIEYVITLLPFPE